MGDRVQLGVRVDAEVAAEFREEVEKRKGQLRGVLGDELEKAMRHYIHHGTTVTADDELAALRESVQRIEAAVGAAPSDGGTPTVSDGEHTHAPSRVEAAADEKPGANAATEKKVRYLAAQLRAARSDGTVAEARESELIDLVKDEYGFRRDTAKRYVSELREWFDLRSHPRNDELLLAPERYEQAVEKVREAEAKNADLSLDEITHEQE